MVIILLGLLTLLILFNLYLRKEKFNKLKICFVSGYIGHIKNLYFIPSPIKKYDCYFISNNKIILNKANNKGWKIIYLDNIPIKNPQNNIYNFIYNSLKSKNIKIQPQKYIQNKYDFYVWFDNKWDLNYNRILKYIMKWDNEKILGVSHHMLGTKNIEEELNASKLQPRYKLQLNKLNYYLNLDKNKNLKYNGHHQTGNLIWNMKNPLTIKFQDKWLQHINIAGIQCQISFNTLIKYDEWRDKIKRIKLSLIIAPLNKL